MSVGNERLLSALDDDFHAPPDGSWWFHETVWFWFFVPVLAYWINTTLVFVVARYRLPAFPFVLAVIKQQSLQITEAVRRRPHGCDSLHYLWKLLLQTRPAFGGVGQFGRRGIRL